MGFYNGKSPKNESKTRHFFSKFAQNSRENDIHVKQESIPSYLGIVNDKKWSPFLDLGIRSPIFLHPKLLKMAVDIIARAPGSVRQLRATSYERKWMLDQRLSVRLAKDAYFTANLYLLVIIDGLRTTQLSASRKISVRKGTILSVSNTCVDSG